MTGLMPYLFFSGTARSALLFYCDVFGGDVELHTYEEFGREDGVSSSIAHGMLAGPVPMCAADGLVDEAERRMDGVVFALLGTAEPPAMQELFSCLSAGGEVIDPLQRRPWGDCDGRGGTVMASTGCSDTPADHRRARRRRPAGHRACSAP